MFVDYLDRDGQLVDNAAAASGFRYFSAQELGTDGFGYRDAFFGACPAVATTYRKDCKLIRTDSRLLFSVSRLHDPSGWFTPYHAIRVERFFKGETIDVIYRDEQKFRSRAAADSEEANRRAREFGKDLASVPPKIAGEASVAEAEMGRTRFTQKFGPDFSELAEDPAKR